MKLREETILIHEIQTLNHNTVLISMALEGGALPPLQAGWGGTCPWCPPASATYISSCSHTLTFLVNGKGLRHLNLSSVYRKSEVVCDQGQYVAMLSLIINNETLQTVSCNLIVTANGELCDISSDRAYIVDIINPYQLLITCPQCPAATECPNIIKLLSHAHKEQMSATQI